MKLYREIPSSPRTQESLLTALQWAASWPCCSDTEFQAKIICSIHQSPVGDMQRISMEYEMISKDQSDQLASPQSHARIPGFLILTSPAKVPALYWLFIPTASGATKGPFLIYSHGYEYIYIFPPQGFGARSGECSMYSDYSLNTGNRVILSQQGK